MYGIIIIDRNYQRYHFSDGESEYKTEPITALELNFLFSEWYLQEQGTTNVKYTFDRNKFTTLTPTYSVINAKPFGYLKEPIAIDIDKHRRVRLFCFNFGRRPVNFGLLGNNINIAHNGYVVDFGGNDQDIAGNYGQQVSYIGPMEGKIIELYFTEQSSFSEERYIFFGNMDSIELSRGQLGKFKLIPKKNISPDLVEREEGTILPANAVSLDHYILASGEKYIIKDMGPLIHYDSFYSVNPTSFVGEPTYEFNK